MARLELNDYDQALLSDKGAETDVFFQLGMMYSTGRSVPVDMVAAHKWFNVAAMKGHREAGRYRTEIAFDMEPCEVAEAQRQARYWLEVC
jgi:TPR repeat protein